MIFVQIKIISFHKVEFSYPESFMFSLLVTSKWLIFIFILPCLLKSCKTLLHKPLFWVVVQISSHSFLLKKYTIANPSLHPVYCQHHGIWNFLIIYTSLTIFRTFVTFIFFLHKINLFFDYFELSFFLISFSPLLPNIFLLFFFYFFLELPSR